MSGPVPGSDETEIDPILRALAGTTRRVAPATGPCGRMLPPALSDKVAHPCVRRLAVGAHGRSIAHLARPD